MLSTEFHQDSSILIFLFGCRLGIDEELVALLGKHSPVSSCIHDYFSICLSHFFVAIS